MLATPQPTNEERVEGERGRVEELYSLPESHAIKFDNGLSPSS